MAKRDRGVTAAEVLVVVGVLVILAALVVILAPGSEPAPAPEKPKKAPEKPREPPQAAEKPARKMTGASFLEFERRKVECMRNVRGLVGLTVATGGLRFPKNSGANLLLYLVKRGDLDGEKQLSVLFCPGDPDESLELAGGVEAYADLDLSRRGEYGHLTSYAGRDIAGKGPEKKTGRTVVLVCDDSEDHHAGKGMVVGLSNGAVKWRDKVDDYALPPDQPIVVGEGSQVPELECLLPD